MSEECIGCIGGAEPQHSLAWPGVAWSKKATRVGFLQFHACGWSEVGLLSGSAKVSRLLAAVGLELSQSTAWGESKTGASVLPNCGEKRGNDAHCSSD
jgi:hypothetical protein